VFFHKKQHEALDNQVKALTKKKERERKCFSRFGIDKYEECIFVAILRSLEKRQQR
jgi:hypothetical protein